MTNKENKNRSIARTIIPIAIILGILIIVAVFVFFVPVMHNDCDSPCDGDPLMSCPSVCVKTEQTIWDIITNQKHVLGY